MERKALLVLVDYVGRNLLADNLPEDGVPTRARGLRLADLVSHAGLEEQREALLSARSDGRVPGWGLGKQPGSQPPPPGAKRFVKSELKNTVILQTEPQIQVPIVLKKPLQRT